MASISSRRLQKELKEIKTEGCPVGTFYTRYDPHQEAQFSASRVRHHAPRSGKLRKVVILNRGYGRESIPGTSLLIEGAMLFGS
jgi:hypothetical protein